MQIVLNEYKIRSLDRFWNKVDKRNPKECWEWHGSKSFGGYGHFKFNNKVIKAHRFSYELEKGSIVPGLHLHHICENKPCVNPAHLKPVTSRMNSLLSDTTLAHKNLAKQHCPKGHPYSGDNLVIYNNQYNGARRCRICINANQRKS